ncbi:MAG: UvrD-helicase domain-containing protein [Natronomonas sp.]
MTDPTPNPRQQELIKHTEGLYLADAGAGTGKTFAITRRYAEIIDQPEIEPADVLLVTFTRSAAIEMKERIVDHSTYSLRELADAPIRTFHAHCFDLLTERGHRAPTHLGLDERITQSTNVIEDDIVTAELFREFFDGFRDDNPEYADFYRVLSDGTALQSIITEFASKGIIPTRNGWYRESESAVDGNFERFKAAFDEVNHPRNDGRKQSTLREKLNAYGSKKTYVPDAPPKSTLRGEATKSVPDEVASDAFYEDREELKSFVHDVYVAYLEFVLGRNYLTFGFLQVFAFVLLCENRDLRDAVSFEYVMVDEFQDTSEIQFKLALLLAATNNFCAVGDWKQSIYSFQYAAVENILNFEDRLERFSAGLNDDQVRVPFDVEPVHRIELTENYRSTQSILDFSTEALVTPASGNEDVDERVADDVVSLTSNATVDNTRIEGFHHDEEHEAVLTAIQSIIDNEAYAVEDEEGDMRRPEYGDIAVFTRTRDFGRELLGVAEEYAFPMAYDGGVELFRTDQAKLLLAWLRILDANTDRGWAVVLERAGYTLDEIRDILAAESYPQEMIAFKNELTGMELIGSLARRVFEKYGFTGEYADVILHTISAVYDTSTMTRGELIRFIERGIEDGSEHEVVTGAGVDSVTVQTIHAAKGLEYPIVILANMNDRKFPPSGGGAPVVRYDERIGLRQRKVYAEPEDYPHVYDNWTHDVLRHCLERNEDEERRLLYVAITRAENHVVFAGGEDPNTFYEELSFDERRIDPAVEHVDRADTVQTQLPVTIVPPDGPTGETPHTLMDRTVFEDPDIHEEPDEGMGDVTFRGREFGSQVHDFAEDYARGDDVVPRATDHPDENNVKRFIDSLDGEFHVEKSVVLPLDVDGDRVTIAGIVDLAVETPETLEIIDYKTDQSRRAESEYRTQLSIYYQVLDAYFPDKDVSASLFYTATGERLDVAPLTIEELKDVVRSTVDTGSATSP